MFSCFRLSVSPHFAPPRPALRLCLVLPLLLAFPEAAQTRAPEAGWDMQQRLAARTAIERAWYDHRNWPKENPDPKPPFEKMVTNEVIERKAMEPLRKTAALKQLWNVEITPEMLQAEMDRMARDTRDPETLKELFAALGNDPALIAETLARDVIADRLIHEHYARDPAFHAVARRRAEAIFAAAKSGKVDEAMAGVGLVGLRQTILLENKNGHGPAGEIVLDGALRLPAETFAALRGEFSKDATLFKERDDGFEIRRALSLEEDRLEIETIMVPKLGFDFWWAQLSETAVLPQSLANHDYRLPAIATTAGCDTWTPTALLNAPSARGYNTGVWTGAEMIIWGGLAATYPDVTGGRYYPATDSWLATSVGANVPSSRYYQTAVWTGNEMIIWGGTDGRYLKNTGGRYNPVSDSWTRTSMTNVPGPRAHFTAVWTGGEMIVWGGGWCASTCIGYNDGGRYNPANDSWMATSTGKNVPVARMIHTAVWTGSEMIVWGGEAIASTYIPLNSGGRYTPATDSWLPTAVGDNVPQARENHTAVWTGNNMIIWGGYTNVAVTNTGGLYNPLNGNWMPTSTGVNTPSARKGHAAVWAGGEMIIWSGGGDNTGGRYNPFADVWFPTSIGANVPTSRSEFSAIWTGEVMIIWGGINFGGNTGGVYVSGSAPSPGNALSLKKSSSISLTWSAVMGAGSYNVKRADLATAIFPYVPTTIVSRPTIPQYSEPNDSQSHFYAVEAVNACGATP